MITGYTAHVWELEGCAPGLPLFSWLPCCGRVYKEQCLQTAPPYLRRYSSWRLFHGIAAISRTDGGGRHHHRDDDREHSLLLFLRLDDRRAGRRDRFGRFYATGLPLLPNLRCFLPANGGGFAQLFRKGPKYPLSCGYGSESSSHGFRRFLGLDQFGRDRKRIRISAQLGLGRLPCLESSASLGLYLCSSFALCPKAKKMGGGKK